MSKSRIKVQNGNDELVFDEGLVSIGGRNGVDVVIDDVMVADRHCVITFEGRFVLRDPASVTGTWLDGERVTSGSKLRDGQTIVVGTTRIKVAIGDDDGIATLELTVEPRSFWWKRAGKGAFDNDPDQLVRSEVAFGRFPALRLGNRVALIAGAVVLLAATFVSSVMASLADAGPLLATHALLQSGAADTATHAGFEKCVELSGDQGCNVCHTTGRGAPEQKCMQCHGLPGQLGGEGSRRHPYQNDGALGEVPGIVVDDQFCVLCHTDHAGGDWLKPAAAELVGKCEACHAEPGAAVEHTQLVAQLVAKARIELLPPQQRPFSGYRFPHDAHLQKQVECETCHQLDPALLADRERGVPDNRARADFAGVRYEVCASCHVPGAKAEQMTAEQQAKWREQSPQWALAWHGTDDDGQHCLVCHDRAERDGAAVIGPELRLVDRPTADLTRYREERARYTTQSRAHTEQFAQHAGDQACTSCHLQGAVDVAAAATPPRTFWHALHLRQGNLAPRDPAAVSLDTGEGCVSCHGDLGKAGADHLTTAKQGGFHWPDDQGAQQACATCHREGQGEALRLTSASTKVRGGRRVPDFPHDVHVGSAAFGKPGKLAEGCFACHGFSEPADGEVFSNVPTTRPEATNCSGCHASHDNVAGGLCLNCHPATSGSNSFLESQKVPPGASVFGRIVPPRATRSWPGQNGFSHLSAGHQGGKCADCHGDSRLEQADNLAAVTVPDEGAALCRKCHLEKQFHWR
ncbi:MAG: FHA domain-containing protein [Planctomycetota bacterium]